MVYVGIVYPIYTEEPEGQVIYIRLKKLEDDPNNDSGYKIFKEGIDLSRILKEYYSFIIFKYKIKNEFFQRITFDYKIKLKEGAKL